MGRWRSVQSSLLAYGERGGTMFGKRLREIRKHQKLSQDQLAAMTGIAQPYLSELERGIATNPGKEVIQGLAKALGVPVAELAGAVWSDAERDLKAEGLPAEVITRLSKVWPDLSPEDRESAVDYTYFLWERSQGKKHRQPNAVSEA